MIVFDPIPLRYFPVTITGSQDKRRLNNTIHAPFRNQYEIKPTNMLRYIAIHTIKFNRYLSANYSDVRWTSMSFKSSVTSRLFNTLIRRSTEKFPELGITVFTKGMHELPVLHPPSQRTGNVVSVSIPCVITLFLCYHKVVNNSTAHYMYLGDR